MIFYYYTYDVALLFWINLIIFGRYTIGLVSKTSDLIIYCLNDQLNRYFRKWGKFPRKVYLQIDGGAENANEVCKN